MNNSDANLKNTPMSGFDMVKEATAVTEIAITMMGLARFAVTAASPMSKAPTMPIVGPRGEGIRMPASLISSKPKNMRSTSRGKGKGTGSLVPAREMSSTEGIISGW